MSAAVSAVVVIVSGAVSSVVVIVGNVAPIVAMIVTPVVWVHWSAVVTTAAVVTVTTWKAFDAVR